MKIMLVTTGQPSLNPRLVKEANTLSNEGYDVTVIYAYWNKWATRYDEQLLANSKWRARMVGGDPNNKPLTYFFSRLLYKLARLAVEKFRWLNLADIAIARSSYFLTREAKKHKADLYIGHNLGAIPAIAKAAAKYKKPCGFDAEDFHRNEISNDAQSKDVILKSFIEDKYFPLVDYLSVSSPQTGAAYKKLFPGIQPITFLNVFSTNTKIPDPVLKQKRPIKLFWFSQTVGPKRGIEDIISALTILNSDIYELHLLGQTSHIYRYTLLKSIEGFNNVRLVFHDPISADQLFRFGSAFDIGLALEPAFSLNNDYALSNKIFTYLQAGLAIIASDTTAQSDFLGQYPAIGKIYPKNDAQTLANTLLDYHKNRVMLLEHRKRSLDLAQELLNWETEGQKFLQLVDQTLNK